MQELFRIVSQFHSAHTYHFFYSNFYQAIVNILYNANLNSPLPYEAATRLAFEQNTQRFVPIDGQGRTNVNIHSRVV